VHNDFLTKLSNSINNIILSYEIYQRYYFAEILKSHLGKTELGQTELTPKDTNPTRWSGRIEAMKPLKLNANKIHAALKEIENSQSFDTNVRFTAGTIAEKMNFEFILSVCIWYDILTKINVASKALQSITSNLQAAIICLENVATFLEQYKLNGYERARQDAEEICKSLGVEVVFIETRKRSANREIIDPEENFRNDFFSYILEVSLNSVTERFEAMKNHDKLFSFLYDFPNMEENERSGNLLQSCKQLESALSHNGKSDVDGDELCTELSFLPNLVKSENITKVIDVLNTIKKKGMENLLPNVIIAYRILLTLSVSVASGERSFSKLKMIKNYLRNSMNQGRLNELTIMSIEHEIANTIEYDDVIDEFAKSKARKKIF
jgi:hAT family C-terminal dimerisation region